MRLSASRLQTWMDCSLKARFKYLDKLPDVDTAHAAFGVCVHHGLEIYDNTLDVERAVAAFLETWAEPERLGRSIEYWPPRTTYGGLRKTGEKCIRDYHERCQWKERTVLATEHKFCVPLGRHTLIGYVDLLQVTEARKGKVLEFRDHKTASKVPTLGAHRVNIQGTVYWYATTRPEFWLGYGPNITEYPPMENGEFYWEMYGDMPRQGIWHYVRSGKEVDIGPRGQDDFLRMYRVANEIERALEHGVFVPNLSGTSCELCPYGEPCGLPISDVRNYDPTDED